MANPVKLTARDVEGVTARADRGLSAAAIAEETGRAVSQVREILVATGKAKASPEIRKRARANFARWTGKPTRKSA